MIAKFLTLSIAVGGLAGCASTTSSDMAENPIQEEMLPIRPENKPSQTCGNWQAQACEPHSSSNRDTIFCRALTYDGLRALPEDQLAGWGLTSCEARHDLISRVCARGLRLESLAEIYCTPDPTFGECPPRQNSCSSENDVVTLAPANSQHTCGASAGSLPWRGWGANACEAKNDLMWRACFAGVRPSLLGRIDCGANAESEACPALTTACSKKIDPHRCRVASLQDEGFVAIALSLCEAQSVLRERACRRQIDWRSLRIDCQPLEDLR